MAKSIRVDVGVSALRDSLVVGTPSHTGKYKHITPYIK